jgi:sortase (surface protein transpeptidase)
VFAELSKLRAGDTVEVIDLNGMSAAFTVRTSKTYSQNEQPEEVFRSDSGTHLNLITCTGDWSNAERQFSQRLVVFTDKQ